MRNGLLKVLLLAFAVSATAFTAPPTVAEAQQILDGQWMKLRPGSAKERNVLFQSVKLIGGQGTSYRYSVSVILRDYDAGYPPNRYYGQTCVARIDNEPYTLWTDGGSWHVDGRMTPDSRKCDANPAAGVSSIPVNTLPGTAAAKGQIAAPPPPQRAAGGVVQGAYECWSGNRANGLLNFTIRAGGQYADSAGTGGTYSVDAANGHMTFRGGSLEKGIPAGMYAMYYEPGGRPTVSIRNSASGGEAVLCQKR